METMEFNISIKPLLWVVEQMANAFMLPIDAANKVADHREHRERAEKEEHEERLRVMLELQRKQLVFSAEHLGAQLRQAEALESIAKTFMELMQEVFGVTRLKLGYDSDPNHPAGKNLGKVVSNLRKRKAATKDKT